MYIAKLCVSTTIQHIYKLARDFAIVVDFYKDKPNCLRDIRGTLRTNKSMYQNSKKTQDSSKIHAATAYQSLIIRVPFFLIFGFNNETPK